MLHSLKAKYGKNKLLNGQNNTPWVLKDKVDICKSLGNLFELMILLSSF